LLTGPGVPDSAEAWRQARHDGAFETAARLAHRFPDIPGKPTEVEEETRRFVANCTRGVDLRRRQLNALIKIDFAHQDELAGWLCWCDACRGRLGGIEGAEVDLSDIPAGLARLDGVLGSIAGTIRDDQAGRIREVRTDKNAEEADALLAALATMPAQAVEDRIAQLRDGRSAAIFQSDADRLIRMFTPGFVTAAAAPGWPRSVEEYRAAFEVEGGSLFIEEDRRAAAAELVVAYVALGLSLADAPASQRQLGARVKTFLELVGGFDRVTVTGSFARLAGARAWKARIQAQITTDGWFLPPSFGSQASSGYDLLVVGPDALPEAVQKALDAKVPSILLLSGVADFARRREYAERLRASSIPALLVDEALVAFAATRRATRARTVFECGLPYGRVEPYTTDAGQIPPEMFFGRHAEIAAIMSKTADGCLVYGGRQLGKSALLHHVHKTYHAPEIDRIVLRREVKPLGSGSEKTSAIWTHLASMLARDKVVKERSRTADEVAADIRGWIELHPHGQIVCMFDETDHFIAAETTSDYRELTKLKELMENTSRAFKVVFAGLHNVQRAFVQPNSPLAHLGRPICIGPLNLTPDDKRAAHDLVVMPMNAAGFRFESGEAVDEILAWANYYPSLFQEFLKGLLATMHGARSGKSYRLRGDGPLWTIPTAELFDGPEYQDIQSRVRDKFLLTLGLDSRYALVAYTLAWLNAVGNEERVLGTGYNAEGLLKECLSFWPKTAETPSRAAFEALLDEMFGLGVLGRFRTERTTRYRYCLASRQVATMLGSEDDILRTLGELAETEPSLSYDRAFHRRAYAPPGTGETQMHAHYSPLTDLQIERLVAGDAPGLRIVCGLRLLGLGKVGPALRRLAETQPQLPGATGDSRVEVVLADSYKGLSDAVTARPPPAFSGSSSTSRPRPRRPKGCSPGSSSTATCCRARCGRSCCSTPLTPASARSPPAASTTANGWRPGASRCCARISTTSNAPTSTPGRGVPRSWRRPAGFRPRSPPWSSRSASPTTAML
jgi:hypothetical protein